MVSSVFRHQVCHCNGLNFNSMMGGYIAYTKNDTVRRLFNILYIIYNDISLFICYVTTVIYFSISNANIELIFGR